jgi:hypothetical protein
MRVPRLIPQETIKAPPTPRATAPGPEAFGGTIASALSQAGAELEAHAKRMQEERDAIKGLNLVVKGQQRITDVLYGEEGLMLQEGLNADGVYKKFTELYPQIIDEIAAEAENDNQRNILMQSMLRQLSGYQSQLAKHEAAELQKAKIQELNANIASLTEMAISSLGDPETMATVTEEIERIAVALGGSYGEEFVISMVNEALDNIHSGIISKLLANDALEAAKDYYEKNKDEISTASQTKIEEFFTKKEKVIFIQEKGYEIFQKFGLNNEAGALAYIRENFSGEDENALMTYVQGVYVDERRFKAEREDNYLRSILNRIGSVQSMTDAIRIVEDSNLDYATKRRLINQIKSDYMGTDVGMWESVKATEEILYRASRPEGHPDAFRNELELLMSFDGRLTKSQQATVYQAWRTRNAHPELGDSIFKAMRDYNIPEGLFPRLANDIYNAINNKETIEKRVLSSHEIENIIKDVVQKNPNVYLPTDYGINISSDVRSYVKDAYGMVPSKPEWAQFEEAYITFINALGGATGIDSISPTTRYEIADVLMQKVVVSRGFFKENVLRGFELFNMGAVLREAPDGSLQWYMNQNGTWVPAWEVVGGMPVGGGKK